MARLLVDMNLSTEWIPFLKAAGHEAVHWSEVGDPRAPDTEQMTWASAMAALLAAAAAAG
jgi:predicted nuclease of predicted toxin-antitoxin system